MNELIPILPPLYQKRVIREVIYLLIGNSMTCKTGQISNLVPDELFSDISPSLDSKHNIAVLVSSARPWIEANGFAVVRSEGGYRCFKLDETR